MRKVHRRGSSAVEVPTNTEAQSIVFNARKAEKALPADGAQMNAVSLVLMYRMYGLRDIEIATLTKLTTEQISRIASSDVYRTMYNELVASLRDSETEVVHDKLVKASTTAADRLTDLVQSHDETVALRASNSVLDRTGHKPADVVQREMRETHTLQIEFIEKRSLDIEDAEYAFDDTEAGEDDGRSES